MNKLDAALEQALQARRSKGLLRSLEFDSQDNLQNMLDFSSNDYLGLARDETLERQVTERFEQVKANHKAILGASGSRLLTGDSMYAQDLENYLAKFHDGESALLFNSGFDANMALMATLSPPNSIVLFDELVHNSCREGIKMCRAKASEQFKHNDVADLKRLLEKHKNESIVIVVIESVYSMDGHIAPLRQMLDLTSEFGAFMVVDEAHGTGVYGKQGEGLTQHLNEQNRVYVRVHTFGKAVGCHGAVVVGSSPLRSYLINYARPLIYSTSLPLHSLVSIRCAYEYMAKTAEIKQAKLATVIETFKERAHENQIRIAESPSPIQAIIIPGNEQVVKCAKHMRASGFRVFPIRSPTVPAGEERIRVVLHDFNSVEEVKAMVDAAAKAIIEFAKEDNPSKKVKST